MTPGARLQASIEVLDALAYGGAPADRALKAWGKSNRYAGSGDRRAVSERVFGCLRERGRLAAAMGGEDGRALVIGSLGLLDRLDAHQIGGLFDGGPHAPAPLSDGERARLAGLGQGDGLGLPGFVTEQLQATFGADWPEEAAALLRGRAPLDLRVKGDRAQVQAALPAPSAPTPWSARGLRVQGAPDLITLPAFAAGLFEVQDEGSQMAAFLAGGGGVVVDYCAGGGGKTLALAQAHPNPSPAPRSGERGPRPQAVVEGAAAPYPEKSRSPLPRDAGEERGERGRLIACDVDQRRLEAIRPRLARAGVSAELRWIGTDGHGVEDLEGQADLVLVDAPCSASGTWRRRPEAAWRLTADEITRLAAAQAQILGNAARLVRPGGRLAYVTCSVLAAENGAVARAFADAHPDFAPLPIDRAARTPDLTDAARARLAGLSAGGHTVQLSPRRTGTDGFFIALFERSA